MLVEQTVIILEATIEEALIVFMRVLKSLFLLKPISYSADMFDLRRQDNGLVIRSISYQLAVQI
jgi:hypothetical protein